MNITVQYQGTYATLIKNCGFTIEEALKIESNYHDLYKESDMWLEEKLNQVAKDGYATLAFGLKLRAPMLSKAVQGKHRPTEAAAEARSVGNALSGQSYGLLNNRAAVEFMKRVWKSEYRYDIQVVSLIHDAIYIVIKDDLDVLKWTNDNLIECMKWQELPELRHDEIKLGAELDVFREGWHDPITLKNNLTKSEIIETIDKAMQQ